MSFATIAAFAAAALAPPAPAAPPAPSGVSGTTTADAALVQEVQAEIRRFGGAALKCADLTGVRASVQPVGWQPADPNFRIGPAGARYERWQTTMCGRAESFLIAIWSSTGGAQFQVGHPFPVEPSAKKAAPERKGAAAPGRALRRREPASPGRRSRSGG